MFELGKWKGWRLCQVPVPYLQWLLKAHEADPMAGGLAGAKSYEKMTDPDLYADIKDFLAEKVEATP